VHETKVASFHITRKLLFQFSFRLAIRAKAAIKGGMTEEQLKAIKPARSLEILLDIKVIQITNESQYATTWLEAGAVLLAVGNTAQNEEGASRPVFALGWPKSNTGIMPQGMEPRF
jgi:hypothetical protein